MYDTEKAGQLPFAVKNLPLEDMLSDKWNLSHKKLDMSG